MASHDFRAQPDEENKTKQYKYCNCILSSMFCNSLQFVSNRQFFCTKGYFFLEMQEPGSLKTLSLGHFLAAVKASVILRDSFALYINKHTGTLHLEKGRASPES